MARRPKISNAPKRKYTKRAPAVTEKTLGESIIEQMVKMNHSIEALVTHLINKPACGAPHLTPVEQVVLNTVAAAANLAPEPTMPAEAKTRARRRTKAEMEAARAAPPAGTVLEQAAEAEPRKSNFPKACPCGVREDLPPHLHSQRCPVHGDGQLAEHQKASVAGAAEVVEKQPAPVPPAAPAATPTTLDDVRGVAIAFAGKHGKEKLAAVLATFKVEKLSSVSPDSYAALMAKLQEGV
jgi:hypothetical protein